MTQQFREARDEGLRSLYVTLIRAGKSRTEAIEAVWVEQRLKYGLGFEAVRRIVCGYKYYRDKKKV